MQRTSSKSRTAVLAILVVTCVAVAASALTGIAWSAGGSRPLAPLASEPVPEPSNLGDFVVDRTAAIALGKAFFWDMQTGSDGIVACATCHYNAGTDGRSKNQVSPKGAAFFDGGANGQLSTSDFPTHRLADPDNAASQLLADTSNVVGSQGVVAKSFVNVVPGSAVDVGTALPDTVFNVGGVNVRQVTTRNAPSAINSAFTVRSFWDGRAQNTFNGVNPAGDFAPGARVFDSPAPDQLVPVKANLENAALASQATGPVLNSVEMSFRGRTWKDVAVKLLSLRPLGEQDVSPSDSVLGPYANPSGKGLLVSYGDLIRQAFASRWWSNDTLVVRTNGDGSHTVVPRRPGDLPADEATQIEANFSLFWGLAVQLYEASLVSDQTPVDRFLAGDRNALTQREETGLGVFAGKGQCADCHSGPELTDAATAGLTSGAATNGFADLGVRTQAEDRGRGDNGVDPADATLDGMFKIPSLRNVALTAPYFHNGSAGTLRQVVEFYNRGGNFGAPNKSGKIKPLNLSAEEKDDLVAFLQALTDPRVLFQQAPFDHPELVIPNGAVGDTSSVTSSAPGVSADEFLELPAVGAAGASTVIQQFPNNPFGPGLLQRLLGGFQPVTAPEPSTGPGPATPPEPVGTPAPPATPAAPGPAPARVPGPSARPVTVTRTRAVATVNATILVKRSGRVRVRAVDTGRKMQLTLLAGSRVGAVVARRDSYALSARIARPGRLSLRLRFARSDLVHGRRFRVLIETPGARGLVATGRIDVVAP
jgi:cytochrome c peroxidase